MSRKGKNQRVDRLTKKGGAFEEREYPRQRIRRPGGEKRCEKKKESKRIRGKTIRK